jgi:hypothetical protein
MSGRNQDMGGAFRSGHGWRSVSNTGSFRYSHENSCLVSSCADWGLGVSSGARAEDRALLGSNPSAVAGSEAGGKRAGRFASLLLSLGELCILTSSLQLWTVKRKIPGVWGQSPHVSQLRRQRGTCGFPGRLLPASAGKTKAPCGGAIRLAARRRPSHSTRTRRSLGGPARE